MEGLCAPSMATDLCGDGSRWVRPTLHRWGPGSPVSGALPEACGASGSRGARLGPHRGPLRCVLLGCRARCLASHDWGAAGSGHRPRRRLTRGASRFLGQPRRPSSDGLGGSAGAGHPCDPPRCGQHVGGGSVPSRHHPTRSRFRVEICYLGAVVVRSCRRKLLRDPVFRLVSPGY
jgi:hypothetical protein